MIRGTAKWHQGVGDVLVLLPRTARVLLGAAVVFQIIYVASLFLTTGNDVVVDGWLSMLSEWTGVAACAAAVILAPVRRAFTVLAVAGIAANTLGDTLFFAYTGESGAAPFPNPADFAYLAFYVLMLFSLLALARDRLRTHDRLVVLDAIVGSLGAASVIALVLTPVLDAAAEGTDALMVVLYVAYPVLDVLLVAVLLGFRASDRSGTPWFLLVAGLGLFATADIVYALQVPENAYVVGTVLDATWTIGVLFMVAWICQTTARPLKATGSAVPTRAGTAVTASAILGALIVLVISPIVSASVIATVLAAATLAATVVPVVVRRRAVGRIRAFDPVTGLLNRSSFEQAVDRSLHSPAPAALLVVNLDDLGSVREGLGHSASDELLRTLANVVRAAFPRGTEIGWLGGDQFAVFVPGAGPGSQTERIRDLRRRMAEPVTIAGIELRTSASVGVATRPENGHTFAALVHFARAARREADARRTTAHIEVDGTSSGQLKTLHELRSPVRPEQIVLEYQPQLRLATGTIDRVEALVRWNHPTRGLLQPAQFLPLLERAGNLTEWTREILTQAVQQAARWNESGTPLAIAVNVTGDALADPEFSSAILPLLAEHDLLPSSLTLEITEQQLLEDPAHAMTVLGPLRGAGIRIALDDFGTGYNSFSSLHELDIDELKIDRSFIASLTTDERSRALVRSIIDLARDLDLETVAEGVEGPDDLALLSRMNCTYAQGYFISRPISAADMDRLPRTLPAR
jgi:diguanylate cyclase (GGDEF)-like protein